MRRERNVRRRSRESGAGVVTVMTAVYPAVSDLAAVVRPAVQDAVCPPRRGKRTRSC